MAIAGINVHEVRESAYELDLELKPESEPEFELEHEFEFGHLYWVDWLQAAI